MCQELLTMIDRIVGLLQLGSPEFIELVASCLSFPTRLISLESEFYNSRYS
jgi:hypothetical protein